MEFSPIDDAALAVMTITRHFSTDQTVFHIENSLITMRELITYINKLGYTVREVTSEIFTDTLLQSAKEKEREYIFETFINEMNSENRLIFNNTHIETYFTAHYLHQLGFDWVKIDMEYVSKYMGYFKKIGYWDLEKTTSF